MPVVSLSQLTTDLQSCAKQLIERVGLVPQAMDRPVEAGDLLFYLSETSMPMAAFLRKHGLFSDADGLHYDLAQFGVVSDVATKVINERRAGNLDGVWREFDLSTDDDMDSDGGYILTALAALELMYGPKT
ncbi:hypothetical protein AAFG07_01955 [Bradyrhizobium sp. B097]|uniref:hypothetical protein n=1 Tax=Bradyrhizobium sp. B097 TaxID=3140244 RepID=UPI0031844E97